MNEVYGGKKLSNPFEQIIIGKILGRFIEQTQGRNECSMKSPIIFPILEWKLLTGI